MERSPELEAYYNLNMEEVSLRQANELDIPGICQLQQKWLEEDSVYGYAPATAEQLKSLLGPYFWVAEVNDAPAGFISGSVHVSDGLAVIPAGKTYLEISDVFVSSQFRRMGIGSKLVQQIITSAKTQGIPYALLYSAARDLHSILRFYERLGFQDWNIQMFRKL